MSDRGIQWNNEFRYLTRSSRGTLDFDTDGVVLKVNSRSLRDLLGSTSKAPRWGIAYKFETAEAITRIESTSTS